MKERRYHCSACDQVMKPRETYLLADGPTSDIVRSVCRACYLRKCSEIREAVRRERDEGFIH